MDKIVLLVLLMFCHWLADFTHLSTAAMLKAKQTGAPLIYILLHALVHAVLMFMVLCLYVPVSQAIFLALFQWGMHFVIDFGKSHLSLKFPSLNDSTKRAYWYVFGLDQFLHQLVIVFMVMNVRM